MAAYWIAHVNIDDAQQCQSYIDLAPLAFKNFRAKFIARGETATSLEGENLPNMCLLNLLTIKMRWIVIIPKNISRQKFSVNMWHAQ